MGGFCCVNGIAGGKEPFMRCEAVRPLTSYIISTVSYYIYAQHVLCHKQRALSINEQLDGVGARYPYLIDRVQEFGLHHHGYVHHILTEDTVSVPPRHTAAVLVAPPRPLVQWPWFKLTVNVHSQLYSGAWLSNYAGQSGVKYRKIFMLLGTSFSVQQQRIFSRASF